MAALVARIAERAVGETFLESLRSGPHALVVAGEAGIGKTTLWQAIVERAVALSFLVLRARPGASETRLSYSGLLDLFGDVDAATFAELPPPQRKALDVALLRADRMREGADQRSIAAAVLTLLRVLARSRPLVIAIDDLQWLDLPTWRLLEFALRRVESESIGVLATQRRGEASRIDLGAIPRERLQEVALGPLNVAALHDVLRDQLGRSFTRPTLVRIERAAGGNAFFAIEVARAMLEDGDPRAIASGRMPLPTNLAELLRKRVRRLPVASQRALLEVAALSQPTLSLIDPAAIEPAIAAAILRHEDHDRLAFSHPMLAASVYESAPAAVRRTVHRDLAARIADPEERARHLALATDAPDEQVASALVLAARAARERGAPDAAIELVELACARTPAEDTDALIARRLELARTISAAGDPLRARGLLRELMRDARPGIERARIILLLSFVADWTEGSEVATALCESALVEAGTDDALRAEIHASAARICDHDPERKAYHARTAVELAQRANAGPLLRSYALLAFAEAELYVGHGVRKDVLDEAEALERAAPPEPVDPVQRLSHTLHNFPGVMPSTRLRGILALYDDDLPVARAAYDLDRRGATDHGDEAQLARTLGRMAQLELRAGNWTLADRYLNELGSVVQRTEQGIAIHRRLLIRAQLDALTGKSDAARAEAAEALRIASSKSWGWETCESHAVLGFVELVAGDVSTARRHLDEAHVAYAKLGLRDPGFIRYQADHIEALVALGDLDEAERALAPYEARARDLGRASALAAAGRCRSLILAARGELDGAVAAIDAACEHHARTALPLEEARTLLVKGQVHRRRKEKAAAREVLTRALAIFERLGSAPLCERARAELDRIGTRPSAPTELTATEQQIAALAASGLTNRAIAERAFLSPKTVEANLARVYQKLGIHSRAELGRAMSLRERTATK